MEATARWEGLSKVFVLTAIAVTLLAGSVRADDWATLKRRGALRVGIWRPVLPEFFSTSNETHPGFDHELLRAFATLHRVRIEVVASDSMEDLIAATLKDQVDLAAGGIVATDARRKRLDFTREVFPTRHVVLNRQPHPPIDSLEQLRRERVGTVSGTSWADVVASVDIPSAQIEFYPDPPALRAAFRAGKVTAIVMASGTAMAETKADPKAQLGFFLGPYQGVAWGVKPGNKDLLAALNDYIQNVRRTATWNRLIVKYWGDDALEVLKKAQAP